jgi:hypothetical protein
VRREHESALECDFHFLLVLIGRPEFLRWYPATISHSKMRMCVTYVCVHDASAGLA